MTVGVVRSMSLAPQPLVLPGAKTAPVAPVPPVRHESSPEVPRPPAPGALRDLARREAQAEELFAQAKAAFQAAEQAGHAEGLRRAAEESRRELERQLAQVGELMRDLAQARQTHAQTLAAQAEPVLLDVLARVFGELGRREEFAVAAVREALKRIHRHQRLCLRVAPHHVPWMQCALAQDGLGVSPEDLDVVADATVVGCCVIDSEVGGLDASLQTQLARLAELLRVAAEDGDDE